MSLYRINTAQRNWFSLHRHAGHSLLKQQSLQLDLGYEVNERVVILAHVGLERVVGNDETAKGDADEPSSSGRLWRWLNLGSREWQTMARNQTHRRLGGGLDLSLTDRASLYIRHQWYSYNDPNFILNQLSGSETLVELKLTF